MLTRKISVTYQGSIFCLDQWENSQICISQMVSAAAPFTIEEIFALVQRERCPQYPFSIIQARWGTSPCPDKIPATCNKQQQQQQHTKINYKNK